MNTLTQRKRIFGTYISRLKKVKGKVNKIEFPYWADFWEVYILMEKKKNVNMLKIYFR